MVRTLLCSSCVLVTYAANTLCFLLDLSRSSIDDSPYTTDIILEDGAAGKTAIGPIVVIDGISDARVSLPASTTSIIALQKLAGKARRAFDSLTRDGRTMSFA